MKSLIRIISMGLLLSACASKQKVAGPEAVTLHLKNEVGSEDITQYYSFSKIQEFVLDQKTRDRDEIVEFRVKEKVKAAKDGQIAVEVSTISKDGTVDLHDLAFPEKKEQIDYVFSSTGEVLKAGDYPIDSVYFVPPLPLPKGPVQVGDTWTMDHAWVGLKNGIPLGIHLIAILKKVEKCPAGQCAEIEVSGDVDVLGTPTGKGRFVSKVWGKLVVAVESGTVIWSEMRSRERMEIKGERTDVLSCMFGRLESPAKWAPKQFAKAECTPSEKPVQ